MNVMFEPDEIKSKKPFLFCFIRSFSIKNGYYHEGWGERQRKKGVLTSKKKVHTRVRTHAGKTHNSAGADISTMPELASEMKGFWWLSFLAMNRDCQKISNVNLFNNSIHNLQIIP